MNNADFWASIHSIIAEGFKPEGLQKLDSYAEQFISGKLVYQRFSPQEQHGCTAGGTTNVIASILAGAKAGSNSQDSSSLNNYERECQLGAQQEAVIEQWTKVVGLWVDDVEESLPQSLGEHIAEGGEAVVYDHGATLVKSIINAFVTTNNYVDQSQSLFIVFPSRIIAICFGFDIKCSIFAKPTNVWEQKKN